MSKFTESLKNIFDNVLAGLRKLDLSFIKKFYKNKLVPMLSSIRKIDLKNLNFKDRKVKIAAIIIAAVVVIAVPTTYYFYRQAQDQTVKIATNKAEQYFYKNEYDKAIEEYNKLNEKETWPLWDVKIAEIYSVEGNVEKSRELLKNSLDKRTKYIEKNGEKKKDFKEKDEYLLNYIVFTDFMNKDFDEALKQGELALSKYKDYKPLIKTMFSTYMSNNKVDKANALVDTYPVDEKSAYDMADYSRMKILVDKWDDGFKYLEKAWNLDKDEYKVYDVLAQISSYNRDALLEKLLALKEKNNDNVAYNMWLAKVYSMTNETADDSIKYLDSLKDKDTGKIVVKLIRASALQNTNKTKEADELLDKVIESNKEDYRVYHTAAWYYLDKGDYKKALEYCNNSILKNKDYPDNYGFLMPEILKKMNKNKEAEPFFRTALLKEPYNYNILLNIANYYWYTEQDLNKAYEFFYKASLIKPNDSEIVYNMAIIKLKQDKKDDCVELLKKSIALNESEPKYHRTLGTIYLGDNKNSDAIKEIRFAYAADKNDILTLNNAGCFYISINGDLERGMVNLKAAYTGILQSTDEYTKKTITENYEKAKKVYDAYNKEDGSSIKVPDFTLFY
ncbi:tetratricopeptide repeat protein [Clostridium fungisolvens]|uniref:Beta-barrel assembly-enhancing protease n=1 Tax=Clostridium fungisolvens TaxID=1604897 RepID=A0A6V8SD27_9CLOT|nr:tetratricopeptide repeat protein [Clostridium fungisolvens]GFP75154.1 Beta-barrel assembly-enhancing protease [Clostridium fungisolvens]